MSTHKMFPKMVVIKRLPRAARPPGPRPGTREFYRRLERLQSNRGNPAARRKAIAR